MKVLLIKTSSMGDIIHTLPAIQDACQALPAIEFHWVVEENFREIPAWHSHVKKIIPVALRRWRKQGFIKSLSEIKAFFQQIRTEQYDIVLDAQGLLKSAIIARVAKGRRKGLNFKSAREHVSTFLYHERYEASWSEHAITRNRLLFAQALGYQLPTTPSRCNITLLPSADLQALLPTSPYILFLHGTTWETKHWPEAYWTTLANQLIQLGYTVALPWGNTTEFARAERIAENLPQAKVLPKLSLTQIAGVLLQAKACVAVDTGLGHLAAVLGVPAVSVYGPTDPKLTGAIGENQIHLAAKYACAPCFSDKCQFNKADNPIYPPCFTTVTPNQVQNALMNLWAG